MADPANPSAEVVLRRFDEQYNKYKFMEANLVQKRKRLCAVSRSYVWVVSGTQTHRKL